MKTDKITKFLLLLIVLGLWFNILKPLLPVSYTHLTLPTTPYV